MMMKVQYAYYYSDEYGVYFIRRIDGESLERHIPKGLYDLCYEEFSRNNSLAVAFSHENKVIHYSDDETMALLDFNFRTLNHKETCKMFKSYSDYNKAEDEGTPSIIDSLKRSLTKKKKDC